MAEIPSESEILCMAEKADYTFFFSDDLIEIIDCEVTKIERITPLSYNVEIRTYEIAKSNDELTLSDLLNPSEIMVRGYKIVFVILYNNERGEWKIEGFLEGDELRAVKMATIEHSEVLISILINSLGDEVIEWSEPEELMRVDVNKIHSSLRKIFLERSH